MLNISTNLQNLDGSVQNNGDIYRQAPSPEVDQAWAELMRNSDVWVSKKDIASMGKDPATAVKFPVTYGFGDDAYATVTDIGHKIHCLDWIRKEIHFDHYW